MNELNTYREKIVNAGLKVTNQRVLILSILEHISHPSADDILQEFRNRNRNVSIGTVYNTLEAFVEKRLIRKLETEGGVVRYELTPDSHFHLYSREDERVEDYFDDELLALIRDHIESKGIKDFTVDEIRLQFIGSFTDK
ncbi:MAG: Fur family transcriptional regulator [Bacteroidota bacterium]|nr:Fur family transcriptional regulator [Bacteroidota bacterium]